MTDLELLKLSADAVDVDVEPYTWNDGTGYDREGYRLVGTEEREWNPFEDSEQAQMLLVLLSLDINYRMVGAHTHVVVSDGLVSASHRVERWDASDAKGLRRAIVMAAAATCELPTNQCAAAVLIEQPQREKATSVMDLRGSVSPPAGAPVVPVEQMRIGSSVSRLGQGESECPYTDQSPCARSAWLDGWEAAARAHVVVASNKETT